MSNPRTATVPGVGEFVAMMALMMSLVAMSIGAMLPALADIGADLGAAIGQAYSGTVAPLVLGFAALALMRWAEGAAAPAAPGSEPAA